jgi:hypothetical protein
MLHLDPGEEGICPLAKHKKVERVYLGDHRKYIGTISLQNQEQVILS